MPKNPSKQMVSLADYIPPKDAAKRIGCTVRCVHQMLDRGEFGDDILRPTAHTTLIPRKAVELVAKNPSKTGRPRQRFAS